MEDKMDLWRKVEVTNKNFTKEVSQRGGFTSINAQSQLMAATEQFGAYGSGWGIKELEYGYVLNKDGNPIEIWAQGMFWYKLEADDYNEFPISGDAVYKPGSDLRKKLLTDMTSKSLSKLGFNADVFMGLYDNPEYMKSLRAAPEAKAPVEPKEPEKLSNEKLKSMLEAIGNGKEGIVMQRIIQYKVSSVQQGKIDKAVAAYNKLAK